MLIGVGFGQASNAYQLLMFVKADLSAWKAPASSEATHANGNEHTAAGADFEANNPFASSSFPTPSDSSQSHSPTPNPTADEPHFPKSLHLIGPLFSAYELNPVAPSAQESIPVPEGLDLDSWIVPPPKEREVVVEKKSVKKGKEKEKTKDVKGKGKKSVSKRTKKDVEQAEEVLVPTRADGEEEVEEDEGEVQRVGFGVISCCRTHADVDDSGERRGRNG